MKKRKLIGLITMVLMIGLSNYCSGYINAITGDLFQQYHFQSASGDFQFTAIPAKGRDTEVMRKQYENHLKREGTPKEEIYRSFRRHPLKFWNWYTYATSDLYQYKYQKK